MPALTPHTDYVPLDAFRASDLEAVRLVLQGGSVIDWFHLALENRADVEEFLRVNGFRPDDPRDRARIFDLHRSAVRYLRDVLGEDVDPVVGSPDDALLIFDAARDEDAPREVRVAACMSLKVMSILHHLDGRELRLHAPVRHAEVLDRAEQQVHDSLRAMRAAHVPIAEFAGGRKHHDAVVTKLLGRRDTIAAEVWDVLRFRIVTHGPGDLLPVLRHMTRCVCPFNYTIPGQSENNVLDFRATLHDHPHLGRLVARMQHELDVDPSADDGAGHERRRNPFSGSTFRTIKWIVDLPVRLDLKEPVRVKTPGFDEPRDLGDVTFVLAEFQVVDRQTALRNEQGSNAHDLYRVRQLEAVKRRLELGAAGRGGLAEPDDRSG